VSDSPDDELRVDVDAAVEFLRVITESGVVSNVAAIHPQTSACTARGFDAQSLDDARQFIEAHAQENLIVLGDRVPQQLIEYATHQWRRSSVEQWIHKKRPPLVEY
jgi:hypothetical protein